MSAFRRVGIIPISQQTLELLFDLPAGYRVVTAWGDPDRLSISVLVESDELDEVMPGTCAPILAGQFEQRVRGMCERSQLGIMLGDDHSSHKHEVAIRLEWTPGDDQERSLADRVADEIDWSRLHAAAIHQHADDLIATVLDALAATS